MRSFYVDDYLKAVDINNEAIRQIEGRTQAQHNPYNCWKPKSLGCVIYILLFINNFIYTVSDTLTY